MKTVGYAAADVAQAPQSGFETDQAAAQALQGAGYAAADTGAAMRSVWGDSQGNVATALKAAGYSANDTGSCIQKAFGLSNSEVQSVLTSSGYPADEAGTAPGRELAACRGAQIVTRHVERARMRR